MHVRQVVQEATTVILTRGVEPSMTDTHELVVPRSMPMT